MREKVIIAVGGTGGHVLPSEKIAKKLKEDYDIIFMGVGLSKNPFFHKEGVSYIEVRGSSLSSGIWNFVKENLFGIFEAKAILKKLQPKFVVGFGSFHAFPVLQASFSLQIPYYLFEFNTVPGRVNRIYSRSARKVFIHFRPREKRILGNLVEIDFALDKISYVEKNAAKTHFGLDVNKPVILVFGGSLGANTINEIMKEVADNLKSEFQIIHFTGKESELGAYYKSLGIKSYVRPFSKEIDIAWQAADLAICRSGAGAMREMIYFKKPVIMIPYPKAKDDHQLHNAKYVQNEMLGGIYLDEKHLNEESLLKSIHQVYLNQKTYSDAIHKYSKEKNRPSFEEVL
jgi:UDP-N-acetylglucosamine--N-acetylmuramyl-(pentapeptide) pyrophosphoryl-undecaprenol N-acetylglucosamine transferase